MNNEKRLQFIGSIKNDFDCPAGLHEIRENESIIEIYDEYSEGLYRIEENDFINVIFYFDRSKSYDLKGPTYDGEVRGVFASRSPRRPSSLGLTTVKLIERNNNILKVQGLDALNGTPVVDIKPYSSFLDETEMEYERGRFFRNSPRADVHHLIKVRDTKSLLTRAGEIHGHYCPGLSLGVLASTELMNKLSKANDGLEEIIAVIETNNCFSDGVQYVSGCTFGNNALVYRDMGKTAVSLVTRDGNGFRASVLPSYRSILESEFSEYFSLFNNVICEHCRDENIVKDFKKAGMETSFAMLSIDLDKLLSVKPVKIELPGYAPIYETVICGACGEGIMSTLSTNIDDRTLCLSCAKSQYNELNGKGITTGTKHILT